eukprot:g10525.t1
MSSRDFGYDDDTGRTPADWGGDELQHADGWITTWAGDSPREASSAAAEVGPEEVTSVKDEKDKKARRDFYKNFTERALAKIGDEYGEGERKVEENELGAKHERVVAWRRWVDLRHRVPGASARLFCCPWAGGNSLAFEGWPKQLPGVEVVPLLLPGRLTRAGESPIRDLPEIVEMAVEALCGLGLLAQGDTSYFILGHEFGALVAFEICRRVEAEFPMKGLFVSSMSCPQIESAMLRRGPPMPQELLENKDLLEIFTPLWFADLSALDTYEYESGTLLECPVHSFGGKKDGEQKMENWAMESSSRESDTILFEGGPFFFLDRNNEAELLHLVRDRCSKSGEGPHQKNKDIDGVDTEARDDHTDSESSG